MNNIYAFISSCFKIQVTSHEAFSGKYVILHINQWVNSFIFEYFPTHIFLLFFQEKRNWRCSGKVPPSLLLSDNHCSLSMTYGPNTQTYTLNDYQSNIETLHWIHQQSNTASKHWSLLSCPSQSSTSSSLSVFLPSVPPEFSLPFGHDVFCTPRQNSLLGIGPKLKGFVSRLYSASPGQPAEPIAEVSSPTATQPLYLRHVAHVSQTYCPCVSDMLPLCLRHVAHVSQTCCPCVSDVLPLCLRRVAPVPQTCCPCVSDILPPVSQTYCPSVCMHVNIVCIRM